MRTRETLLGLLVLGLVAGGAYWARLGPASPAAGSHHPTATAGGAEQAAGSHDEAATADAAIPDVTVEDGTVVDGDIRITLSVAPRPPLAFTKTRFRVRVESASAKASADRSGGAPVAIEAGRISFEMVMPMGDHRYTLVPGDAGWHEAEVVLPFCKSGNPRWYAIVDGTVGGRAFGGRFRLDLTKPGMAAAEATSSGGAPGNHETVQADDVVLQRVVDPVTSVEYIRILAGIPEQAATTINGRLTLEASELGESHAECEDFEASISPRFVSRVWMAFDVEREGYCGGPGRFTRSSPLVVASDTGENVNFALWIDGEYLTDTIGGKLRDLLIRAVLQEWKDIGYAEVGKTCVEVLERSRLLPWMDASGFNFRLQTDDSQYWTCASDYRIPFETMHPFIAKPYVHEYDRFVSAARELAKVTPARVVELRQAIDGQRARYGLSGFAWSGAVVVEGGASVQPAQLKEFVTALQETFVAAGQSDSYIPDANPSISDIQGAVFSLFKLGRPDKANEH